MEDGRSAAAVVPTLDGKTERTVSAIRSGDEINVTVAGGLHTWSLLLAGIASVTSVEGGVAETTPQGVLLTIGAGAESLSIGLNGSAKQVITTKECRETGENTDAPFKPLPQEDF